MVFKMEIGMGFNRGFGMGLTQEEFSLLQIKTPNWKIQTNPDCTCKNNDRIDLLPTP